jgi:signal peptidase I
VPLDKLVGRALFIVWPIDHVTWLGVPERTFSEVPAPVNPPAVAPSGSTTGPAKAPAKAPATTKAPAG